MPSIADDKALRAGRAFDADAAARAVAEALRPFGTPERAAQQKRYLKSDLEFIGVTVPDMRRVVTAAVKGHSPLDREDAVAWAVSLWREPVHERRGAAVEVLGLARKQLRADDLTTVETLIRDSRTWALVDPLAGDIAGTIALRDPSAWDRIDGWATDAGRLLHPHHRRPLPHPLGCVPCGHAPISAWPVSNATRIAPGRDRPPGPRGCTRRRAGKTSPAKRPAEKWPRR